MHIPIRAAWFARLFLTVIVPGCLLGAPSAATGLPAADYFRPPEIISVQLNPAGTHLAMLVYESKTDSTGLRIVDLASQKVTGLAGSKTFDLYALQWINNEEIVYSMSRGKLYAAGLYLMHRDRVGNSQPLNANDALRILGVPLARPTHLLVWITGSALTGGGQAGLLELDLKRPFRNGFGDDYGNTVEWIKPPPGDGIAHWMRDRTGEVRYAVATDHGAYRLHRRAVDGTWNPVNLNFDDAAPLAVDSDPNKLLVARTTAAGPSEIVRFDTQTGTTGPALYQDDKYDLRGANVRYSEDGKQILGFGYRRQAYTQFWLSEDEAALQKTIDDALPDRINLILSRSQDGRRLVIQSSSDRHPGTFYLFEPAAGKLAAIANRAPWLPESQLSRVTLMRFKSRDGLSLDAYLTLPAGTTPGRPAPMIVIPHGGPWVRNAVGYDAEAQFFASRGYVVFQPNYRGSSGYGPAISQVPRFDFRGMHNDVTDGTQALIKAGIADPARVAILGSSFGGYLAICGAAYEPGLYRCAVTIAGVFDWERVMKDARFRDPETFRYDFWRRNLGDPREQAAKFESISPLRSTGQIKIPVFVAHGEVDPVADSSQSHRLVRALGIAGVPCETLFVSEEAHGFAALTHRVELYTRIESFLKKNL